MPRTIVFMMSTLLPAAVAVAHPGHGQTEPYSPTHYVFEPTHAVALIAMIAGGLLIVWGAWKLVRRRRR